MRPHELGANAAEYFGALAESYDSLIRRAVPRYDEMTERLLDYLPELPGRAARVLELGTGTGNLTLRLAGRYPDATITSVDASPEMLAVTRLRLGPDARRVTLLQARFEELEPVLGHARFDLVTSCISLHHVREKGPLYAALGRMLVPGGTFRFADQLRGGTEANHARNWARWLELCRAPGQCTELEVRSLLDHAAAHDHYTPLAEHFRRLESAGFRDVDCVWRNWIWGIVTAEHA